MDTAGTTRREVLKKGAVAGAIVWAAPIVSSSPAFAASGQCSGSKPCTNFYLINSTGGTNCEGSDESCDPPAITNCQGQTVTPQSGCNLPAASKPTIVNLNSSATVTYDPGVIPIYFVVKLGSHCYFVDVIDTDGVLSLDEITPEPPECNDVEVNLSGDAESGYVFTVTVGDTSNCSGIGGHGISHISTAFCL
jgi:hypothetical protein